MHCSFIVPEGHQKSSQVVFRLGFQSEVRTVLILIRVVWVVEDISAVFVLVGVTVQTRGPKSASNFDVNVCDILSEGVGVTTSVSGCEHVELHETTRTST